MSDGSGAGAAGITSGRRGSAAPGPVTEGPGRVAADRGPARDRNLAIVLTLATIAVVAAAALVTLRRVPVAYTDWALIELGVRSVGGSWPTVGAPSGFGLHHPGPLEYLVLAPFYRALGQGPWALGVGATAVNAAAIGVSAWLAWRRGRLALVLVALAALATMAAALGAGFLVDTWNPWIALFPAVAFLLAVWSVVEDDMAALPVLVVAGSWTVQAHFSYAVVVGPLAVAAVVSLVARAVVRARSARRPRPSPNAVRTVPGTDPPEPEGAGTLPATPADGTRDPVRRRARAVLAVGSAGLLVLCWLAPVAGEIADRPNGNLVATMSHFARPPAGTTTLRPGDLIGTLATELGWRAPAFAGQEPVNIFVDNVEGRSGLELLPVLALVIAAAVVARVRRDGSGGRLLAVGVAAALLGAFGVSRLEVGRVFPHVVRSIWAIDLVLMIGVVWIAVRAARGRWVAVDRAAWVVGVVVLGAGLLRLALGAPDVRLPINQPDQAVGMAVCVPALGAEAAAVAAAAGGPAATVHLETEEFWPVAAAGVADQLAHAGIEVAMGEHLAFHAGVSPADRGAATPSLLVVDEAGLPTVAERPGWRVVTVCDPLTPAERTELTTLLAQDELMPAERQRAFALRARSARFGLLAAS